MTTFDDTSVSGAVDFVIDENRLMIAMQLAIKDMQVGSRACLWISDHWAQGPLLPSGNPVMRGAAIWAEITLISVVNEPSPTEHGSVSAALAFALEKKQQGNASLILNDATDWNRAVRRYEAGIETLEALLPDRAPRGGASSSPAASARLLPSQDELPPISEALAALRLNAAQGELKRCRWKSAVEFCNLVLHDVAGNAKAHYRRGVAKLELGDFEGLWRTCMPLL